MKKQGIALLMAAAMMLPSSAYAAEATTPDTPPASTPSESAPSNSAPNATPNPAPADSGSATPDTTTPSADPTDFDAQLTQLLTNTYSDSQFCSVDLTLNEKKIVKDGKTTDLPAAPVKNGGTTMLPVRAVAEAIGGTVTYDASTKTATVTSQWGDIIECPIGQKTIMVNGETQELSTSSYASEGSTYLPLRAVSEAMGLEVEWRPASQSIHITAPYQTARVLVYGDADTSSFQTKTTLNDHEGLQVLQFSTPKEAEQAVEKMTASGIVAEPDRCLAQSLPIVPKGDTMTTEHAKTEGSSWGFEASGFDRYLPQNADKWKDKNGVIAVLDDVIDVSHPSLQGRVLPGKDFVEGDHPAEPTAVDKHGTQIAGVIAECTKDTNVKILPLRVIGHDGWGYSSSVAAAIQYAVRQKVDIVNLSLGGSTIGSNPLQKVIQNAVKQGILVVTAAGNDNQDAKTNYPGCMTDKGVLVVAAADKNCQKASFSNWGESVDLMAAGVEVESAVPAGYLPLDGCGVATAHVTAAAMLMDLVSGKTLSPEQLEERLLTTATTNKQRTDPKVGYGFLDLASSKEETPVTYTRLFWRVTNAGTSIVNVGADSWVQLTCAAGSTIKVDVCGERTTGEIDQLTEKCPIYSDNTKVASISKDGLLTAVAAGESHLYIESAPNTGLTLPPLLMVQVQ